MSLSVKNAPVTGQALHRPRKLAGSLGLNQQLGGIFHTYLRLSARRSNQTANTFPLITLFAITANIVECDRT